MCGCADVRVCGCGWLCVWGAVLVPTKYLSIVRPTTISGAIVYGKNRSAATDVQCSSRSGPRRGAAGREGKGREWKGFGRPSRAGPPASLDSIYSDSFHPSTSFHLPFHSAGNYAIGPIMRGAGQAIFLFSSHLKMPFRKRTMIFAYFASESPEYRICS
jgi:hypothetical protein